MKFQPPKGTRDLLPEDANKLQKIIEVCRDVFEKYGFEPLLTPAFESFELLSAKGGLGEAVKDEIYYFKDKSDRELGLRFDLTMPLARFISSNPQLPKPFKRYAIDKVWRYDNPQAKRWREFFQADIDTIGSAGLVADVECLTVVCEILDRLGFKEYLIRVNSRKIIQQLLEKYIKKDEIQTGFRILDKLDKNGIEWVRSELSRIAKPNERINNLIEFLETKGRSWDIIRDKNADKKYQFIIDGLLDLKELYELSEQFGISKRIQFDASLVRGLDYYSGVVFEVNLGTEVSCGGGGRYDKLIEAIGGESLVATGISLGLDRILEVMKENKMFKTEKSKTAVFVANVDNSVINDMIKVVQKFRKNGISSQMNLMQRNLTKQLEYADSLDIPYVLIVGKKEIESGKFKLKDMKKKIEKELTVEEIIKLLK